MIKNKNILIIEDSDDLTKVIIRTKGERYDYIFIPTKFEDTNIEDLMAILVHQKEMIGKLCVYETVCDSSEWK